MTTDATAGSVIAAALAEEVERLLQAEPAVRADKPDAVHQMRVATRRMRSVLRTYRPLLEGAQVDLYRDELRWLGGVLGAARDAEVSAQLMERGLAALPKGQVRGPVAERLVGGRQSEYADAHAATLTTLDSARYADLRVRLSGLKVDPPLRRRARKQADTVMSDLIRKDLRRLNRLIAAAARADGDARVLALHEVRKGAKRVRYAAEAAQPVLGDRAATLAAQAKRLQTVLGDHRDAVEAQQYIDAAAALATAAGEDDFTYRLLSKSQADAATDALAKYPAAASSVHDALRA